VTSTRDQLVLQALPDTRAAAHARIDPDHPFHD
jgi:hypothetical protein